MSAVVDLLDDGGERDRDRERGEREVGAAKPQSRDAEQEPDDPRDQARERQRPHVLDAVVGDQDRGRVAADRHEGAVAEGDLAGVAGEDVQAEHGDEVDADVAELVRLEDVDPPGDQGEQRERAQEPADAESPADHTRDTAARPNRPAGRTRRTTRMIPSATGSWSSVPTKST